MAQYRPIDTLSWSNQVFAYRDNSTRPHQSHRHGGFWGLSLPKQSSKPPKLKQETL